MFVERTIVGVLVAGALAQRDFSHEDTSLLKLAADRAAIAIENARLYRKAEERADKRHGCWATLPTASSS